MFCQANVCLEDALCQLGLNCLRTVLSSYRKRVDIVSKLTVTHNLPNSDLLLGKCLLILLREGERVKREWPQIRCLVAAAVEIQDFEVRFSCRTFGAAHAF